MEKKPTSAEIQKRLKEIQKTRLKERRQWLREIDEKYSIYLASTFMCELERDLTDEEREDIRLLLRNYFPTGRWDHDLYVHLLDLFHRLLGPTTKKSEKIDLIKNTGGERHLRPVEKEEQNEPPFLD